MARIAFSLVMALVWVAATGEAAMRPLDVDRFFVEPDRQCVLRWRVAGPTLRGPVEYTIRDYWGREIATGRGTPGADGILKLTVKLPRGFFDIVFPAARQRFGLVSLAPPAGRPDDFFSIDSAMSWLVRPDDLREGLVKALRRSGVAMSRERLTWASANPAAGKWDWQTQARYERLRLAYRASGVDVLDMFHDAPKWTGPVGKYPGNLAATARAWEQVARRWQGTWGALEIWNEPDIFFGSNLPADQYLAVVRAVAYGYGRAKVNKPLVGGSMAHCNRAFLNACGRNGLLDLVDVVSFHTYIHAPHMEALVGRYRQWLGAFGRPGKPLWLTECGRPWRKGPDRPPARQGADSALDITMKAVEARCCGVERYFAFVYPFYEERQNNFGMMGRQGTPLRPMAAYAALLGALAHKEYLGDLALANKALQRARVFGDAKETVAVLYTGRADNATCVKVPVRPLGATGIDGRPLAVGKDGSVPLGDGLCYVRLDARTLGKHLRRDTPAKRLYRMARGRPAGRVPAGPVVMRYEWDAKAIHAVTEGYRIAPEQAGKIPLSIRVFCLDNRAHSLRIDLTLPKAGKVAKGQTPQPVTVPAGGSVLLNWQLDLAGAFGADNHATVLATARETDKRELARLAVDFLGGASMEQLLERHRGRIPLPITDLKRWRPNAPSYARATMKLTPQKHWQLDVTFAQGDPWVYPYFELPAALNMRTAKALVLRARCDKAATVRAFLWEGRSGVGYLTPNSIIPSDGSWHTAVVPISSLKLSTANAPDANHRLDLEKVRRISLGMNSHARANALEVSEAWVLYDTLPGR